jgi:hypothetical protein
VKYKTCYHCEQKAETKVRGVPLCGDHSKDCEFDDPESTLNMWEDRPRKLEALARAARSYVQAADGYYILKFKQSWSDRLKESNPDDPLVRAGRRMLEALEEVG